MSKSRRTTTTTTTTTSKKNTPQTNAYWTYDLRADLAPEMQTLWDKLKPYSSWCPPLHAAMEHFRLDFLQALLAAGADPYSRDAKTEKTALEFAQSEEMPESYVKALEQGERDYDIRMSRRPPECFNTAKALFKARKDTSMYMELLGKVIAPDDSIRPDSSPFAKYMHGLDAPQHYTIKYYLDDHFALLRNTQDNDDNWQNPDRNGRASMSKTHLFLVPVDGSDACMCNVLTMPADDKSLALLSQMNTLAHEIALEHGVTNPGLYFHCYPASSVPWLHLHIVDMDNLGPAYEVHTWKNLPLDDVISVLETEQFLARQKDTLDGCTITKAQ